MKIAAVCPTCGTVRYLRPADARKAKQCRHCHLTAIAPKGWEGLKAERGEKAAVQVLRTYRLGHPSNLEQRVMEHLDAADARYEREVWFEDGDRVYLLDFVLADGTVIEVNGEWAHQYHADRDARKLDALNRAGRRVIVLNDQDVKNALDVRLASFVS